MGRIALSFRSSTLGRCDEMNFMCGCTISQTTTPPTKLVRQTMEKQKNAQEIDSHGNSERQRERIVHRHQTYTHTHTHIHASSPQIHSLSSQYLPIQHHLTVKI